MHQPPLPPRKYACYSFLLQAELTPGPQCGWKDYINEKSYLEITKKKPAASIIRMVKAEGSSGVSVNLYEIIHLHSP
jgi:aspartate aminotransferase-like enzyme